MECDWRDEQTEGIKERWKDRKKEKCMDIQVKDG